MVAELTDVTTVAFEVLGTQDLLTVEVELPGVMLDVFNIVVPTALSEFSKNIILCSNKKYSTGQKLHQFK